MLWMSLSLVVGEIWKFQWPFQHFSQIAVNRTCLAQSLILKQNKQDKALHQRIGHTHTE